MDGNGLLPPFPAISSACSSTASSLRVQKIWKEVRQSRLFPFHHPAKVVESGDQRLASRWRARWEQGHFALSRLKFHLGGLLSYTWELPAWERNLQRFERGE